MNFRRCLWVILAFYLIILPVFASELDNKLNDLSKQIISNMTKNKGLINQNNKVTIAVIEFPTIEGTSTLLGRSIAEQLTTKLYLTKKFDIIERGLLNKVLAELQLNTTSIIDSESAKRLGKILGVNAIVTGTITELDKSLQLNARLIATETGLVFGVAAVEMKNDADTKKLLSKVITNSETESIIETASNIVTATPTANPVVINTPIPEIKVSPTLTSISSQFPIEAEAFINPILAAIKNNPPNYWDDFSTRKYKWSLLNEPGVSKCEYNNQSYFITTVSFCDGVPSALPKFSDFVLEIDGKVISGEGCWSMMFRNTDYRCYNAIISSSGGLNFIIDNYGNNVALPVQNPSCVNQGSEPNHLMIIAKGEQFAIFVNGELASFTTNKRFTKGSIYLKAHSFDFTPFTVQVDNLKIWDLIKLKL